MQMLGPEIHSHGEASQPPDRIRQDILYRLRWSVLWSVEKINIESGLNKDGTEKRQPFLSHPLAMESLADPPVIRLQLSSVDLYEVKHFYMLSESYSDEPVIIENTDGRPITFTDFVTEAHKYLSQHKDALVLCRKNAGFSNSPHQEILSALLRYVRFIHLTSTTSSSNLRLVLNAHKASWLTSAHSWREKGEDLQRLSGSYSERWQPMRPCAEQVGRRPPSHRDINVLDDFFVTI
jgi:hypothetical protein